MNNQTKIFLNNSGTVRVIELDKNTIQESLTPAIYEVNYNQMTGYYLTYTTDKYKLPKYILGSTNKRVDKVINTYNNEPNKNTGVLLLGEKGSGKTLLSQVLTNKMVEQGVPVVTVNTTFSDSSFVNFIKSLDNVCIIFDEFDKHYYKLKDEGDSTESQTEILKLFEDNNDKKSKNLNIIIANNEYRISDFLMDRPSRFKYRWRYNKVELEVVEELCAIHKLDEDKVKQLIDYSKSVRLFSFDILEAIIKECLLYSNDDFQDVIKDMNVPSIKQDVKYRIEEVEYKGKTYKAKKEEYITNYFNFSKICTAIQNENLPDMNTSYSLDKCVYSDGIIEIYSIMRGDILVKVTKVLETINYTNLLV
jgi:energy-coupling factor transporter ATP-binding protein EcfA2